MELGVGEDVGLISIMNLNHRPRFAVVFSVWFVQSWDSNLESKTRKYMVGGVTRQ